MVVNLQGNWGLLKGLEEGRKGHPGEIQGAHEALQPPHSTSSAKCHRSCFTKEVQKLIDNFLDLFFSFFLLVWIQASFYDYSPPITWSWHAFLRVRRKSCIQLTIGPVVCAASVWKQKTNLKTTCHHWGSVLESAQQSGTQHSPRAPAEQALVSRARVTGSTWALKAKQSALPHHPGPEVS